MKERQAQRKRNSRLMETAAASELCMPEFFPGDLKENTKQRLNKENLVKETKMKLKNLNWGKITKHPF